MKSNHIVEPQAFSWKYLIWGIGAISVAVLILVNSAILYNDYRSQKVVSEYSTETIAFVSTKKNLFRQLFTGVVQTCQIHDDQEKERGKVQRDYLPSDLCPQAQEMLSTIKVESLKNSSAIAYLAVQGNNVVLIEASGKYHPPASVADQYIFSRGNWGDNTYLELNEYLTQSKQLTNYWQDFIGYIPGKEVIVPIDIDGTRLGYIFRGVIER